MLLDIGYAKVVICTSVAIIMLIAAIKIVWVKHFSRVF